MELFFARGYVLVELYYVIDGNSLRLLIEVDIIYLPVAVFVSRVHDGGRDINDGSFRVGPPPIAIFIELRFFFVPVVIEVGRIRREFFFPLHVGGSRESCFECLADLFGGLLNSIIAACKKGSDCK